MKKLILIFLSIFIFFDFLNADGYPVNGEINNDKLEIAKNSKSAILIEASTKSILYEKNAYEKLAPASMTKIMTLLLAMEEIDSGRLSLDEEVIISKNASSMGGTQIFAEANSKIKVSELLKGVAIASANDAAVALAEKIGGTEENFVNMMNQRAKELGANDTFFKNPHGLDEANHYSTSYDMALIASELVSHESILKITSTYEDYIMVGEENHWLVNTNTLVRFYEGMDGLKTGYTDNAKYCLTSTMSKNGMRLIGVVMGAENKEDRNEDTINMMEYGFATFSTKTIYKKDDILGEIYINNSKNRNIEYKLASDVKLLVDRNTTNTQYTIEKELYEVKAPLKKGDVIGKMKLNFNKNVFEYDLVVKENVEKSTFFRMMYNNFLDIVDGNINLIKSLK